MNTEYRTCLDVHSLGLSAVRCFVELMPNLDLVDDLAADPWLSEARLHVRVHVCETAGKHVECGSWSYPM